MDLSGLLIYGLFASVMVNVVLGLVGFMIWKITPPSAMMLIKRKLGSLKDKTLILTGYHDGAAFIHAMDVARQGWYERVNRKGEKEVYVSARPHSSVGDQQVDRFNHSLDDVMLPCIRLDGIDLFVAFAHDAVTVNLRSLLGLEVMDYVDPKDPEALDVDIRVPEQAVVSEKSDGKVNGKCKVNGKGRFGVATVRLLLGVNPFAIHHAVRGFLDHGLIESLVADARNSGRLDSSKNGKDQFKLMVILGAVLGGLFAVAGLVAFLFGGGVLG